MQKQIFLSILFLMISTNLVAQQDPSLIYTHEKPTSFLANTVKLFLKINKFIYQNKIQSMEKESKAAKIPKRFLKKYIVDTIQIEGRNVYTLSPKKNRLNKYIIYLHGGSYVHNVVKPHWYLVDQLIEHTNATVILPDYPLAPQHQVLEGMAFMDLVYEHLLLKVNSKNIIIMGDSAGGGFSLAFSQKLKKEGKQLPSQIILLAPWLDISTSNPEMKAIEKKDASLIINRLKIKGKYWAGDLDTQNYLVSPINGDLKGLGKISIFIGGQDIFIADTEKIKLKMEQQNIPFNYFEYPKMFHVWMGATFLKESKVAISQISELVMQEEK